MLDDFLRENETSSFLDEVSETSNMELTPEPETGFLGMTAGQRFVLAFMFFLMVVIIGAFCLLITGSIGLVV
jgi:hypothetical protein